MFDDEYIKHIMDIAESLDEKGRTCIKALLCEYLLLERKYKKLKEQVS